MNTWKPIETAPKDGTPILACILRDYTEPHGWPMTISWRTYHPNSPGKKQWRDALGNKRPYMSHWMPLPSENCDV